MTEVLTAVIATVQPLSVVVPTVEGGAAIDAVVESLTELAAEIQTMGMTAAQIAKLNSIAWNARNYQPDYITLVRATAKGTASGDSDPWILTTSFNEVTQWALAHPAWRDNGILEIDATARYKQSSSAHYIAIELQTADDYQTENTSTATSTFGLPESWTTVLTINSPALACTSTEERMVARISLTSEGHTSTTCNQVVDYYFNTTDSGISPSLHYSHGVTSTTIDTTKDILMRLRFKVQSLEGDDYAHIRSNYVGLKHPRDGHGY